MSSPADLRLDWCSAQAATFAVKHWHYSRSLPPPPHNRIGVWEGGRFIGVVLFARGANLSLLTPYGLRPTDGCELVRVALTTHRAPVSRIVAIAVKFLRQRQPGLRLVVSFADPQQGHHGGIYQALGWLYLGTTGPSFEYRDPSGRRWHPRMISPSGVKPVFGRRRAVLRPDQCTRIERPGKHRYALPLDDVMRAKLLPLVQPYPTRTKQSDRCGPPRAEGGEIPTRPLQHG